MYRLNILSKIFTSFAFLSLETFSVLKKNFDNVINADIICEKDTAVREEPYGYLAVIFFRTCQLQDRNERF